MTDKATGRGIQVVVGGTGAVGRAVVDELVARGHRVRSVARRAHEGRAGVEARSADMMVVEQAREALAGASVVYHCAMPAYTRWAEEFPTLQGNIVDATRRAGAKLVAMENLYMYGPGDGPMRESMPMRATGKKGGVRARLSQDLLAAHAAGQLRVAIGRASDYYGPAGVNSAVGDTFFRAIGEGKRPRWLGRLDQPHVLSYLPDVAAGLVTLGERDDADGEAWHLPVSEALTGQEWADRTSRVLGRPVQPSRVSRPMVVTLGLFLPLLRELRETLYQWERPWVVDDSRVRTAFGIGATPTDEAIARTIEWFERR